jgi:hypothetical protein
MKPIRVVEFLMALLALGFFFRKQCALKTWKLRTDCMMLTEEPLAKVFFWGLSTCNK